MAMDVPPLYRIRGRLTASIRLTDHRAGFVRKRTILKDGGMTKKSELYRTFIERMEAARKDGHRLEAAWYAYAVIEDRMRSLLQVTGLAARPRMMLGDKIQELENRRIPEIDAQLDFLLLKAWKEDRNNLMHAMAGGALSIEDIDKMSERLARDGCKIARSLASLARRMKKRAAK